MGAGRRALSVVTRQVRFELHAWVQCFFWVRGRVPAWRRTCPVHLPMCREGSRSTNGIVFLLIEPAACEEVKNSTVGRSTKRACENSTVQVVTSGVCVLSPTDEK